MPQLAKGGKWVFGWSVVSARREIRIPPEAYAEYGYRDGEEIVFLAGSRTSGGFRIGRPEKLATAKIPLEARAVCRGSIGPQGRIELPPKVGAQGPASGCWSAAEAVWRCDFSAGARFSKRQGNTPCSSNSSPRTEIPIRRVSKRRGKAGPETSPPRGGPSFHDRAIPRSAREYGHPQPCHVGKGFPEEKPRDIHHFTQAGYNF